MTQPAAPSRRSDGERTHAAILEAAMRLASVEGLSNLTIGRLARELDISKSGVFAHFRSKEWLQQETVLAAGEVFEREVVAPGLVAPEGRGQVEALCAAYLDYVERGVFAGGCFFAQLLAEFDASTGPLHDDVAEGFDGWLGLLADRVAVAQAQGELDPAADPAQVAFELYGPMELANYLFVLHRDRVYVERGRAAVAAVLARTSTGAAT